MSARLLFIACWNFSDDHGGLDRSAKQLKAQAFPYDSIDCEPLVQELLNVGLLIEYAVGGKTYLHISGFRKHQKVEKPAKPRIPLYDESLKTHRGVVEESGSPPLRVAVSSSEGNGRETEGKKNCTAAAPPGEPPWFAEFRMLYPPRAGDQPTRPALRAANARLAEGHSADEFLDGARRYAAFVIATGKENTEYVQQWSRFLGPSKPFMQPWALPASKADARLAGNLSAAEEFMRRTEVAQ